MAFYAKTITRAERLWDLLDASADEGLTKAEMLREADITPTQWRNAIEYIKDVFQGAEQQPLCYDPLTHRYTLTEDVREEANYMEWTARGLLRRMQRFENHLDAAASKFPQDRRIRRVRRHADMITEDLDDLVHDAENGSYSLAH